MARLLVYYAHPGQRHSRLNRALADIAREVDGISFIDLYAEYPRHEIDIDREQKRLVDHDVVLFQFPMFWYSTPSLVKEWIDLVLEHGFAYGKGGDALYGKRLMLAVSAGAPEEAYSPEGYQRHPLRTFLLPLEQTAILCHLAFTPPYTLYGSLRAADEHRIEPHADGYRRLLEAVRDDRFDFDAAARLDVITCDSLPIGEAARA
ncbi:MAG: NAD(P)H-dependent oxidoreductase [Woeseiaceae bacterium]|nr:NAD(P)H-dependent oxidoreductase [Woeseiaceae bacterium]